MLRFLKFLIGFPLLGYTLFAMSYFVFVWKPSFLAYCPIEQPWWNDAVLRLFIFFILPMVATTFLCMWWMTDGFEEIPKKKKRK